MIGQKSIAAIFMAMALTGCQDVLECTNEDRSAKVRVQADFVSVELNRINRSGEFIEKIRVYSDQTDRGGSGLSTKSIEKMKQQARAYCASGTFPQ